MRTQKKMLLAAVLAASLVGMSTGPVMADEDGKDEGATVLQSELPPSERSLLERAGVRGAEVNIQPLGEYTLVSDGQNWTITESGSGSAASPMNIEFGVGICKGGFFLPKKVNSNVEWGAWNDCNVYGSASTYVHSISAQLWMQTGAFAFQKTKQETAMSPLESVSSKVVTAHRVKKCDTTYTKEFQIQAEVTLKSKKMGVVKSDNVKLACNFKVS